MTSSHTSLATTRSRLPALWPRCAFSRLHALIRIYESRHQALSAAFRACFKCNLILLVSLSKPSTRRIFYIQGEQCSVLSFRSLFLCPLRCWLLLFCQLCFLFSINMNLGWCKLEPCFQTYVRQRKIAPYISFNDRKKYYIFYIFITYWFGCLKTSIWKNHDIQDLR